MGIKHSICGFFMIASTVFALLASPPAAFADTAAEAGCQTVARFFDSVICKDEISVETAHINEIKKQYEQQGLDSEKALLTRSRERLREMIWTQALNYKFGEDALRPTEEEIYYYGKAFKNALKRSHEENKKNLTEVKEMLAHRTYPPDQEAQMKALLATLQTSIAFYEEHERQTEAMPPEFHQMVAETQRELAESMIRKWKTDKLLYQEYGGRLADNEHGLTPVDAYRAFLHYIKSEGALVLPDQDYQNLFADLEHPAESGTMIEKDGEKAQRFFASPYWQFEDKN